MKKGIHPEYHTIKVTLVDGKTVEMFSSVKKDMVLDTDPTNHPAWTGNRVVADRGQRSDSFKKKFSGFKF